MVLGLGRWRWARFDVVLHSPDAAAARIQEKRAQTGLFALDAPVFPEFERGPPPNTSVRRHYITQAADTDEYFSQPTLHPLPPLQFRKIAPKPRFSHAAPPAFPE
ncbi:hypothetical protein ASF79_02035 [Agreia sp. Leaf335]|uniref:hypothetical protein n=1 Tax=Agreia sp. Leaf335 TaxID=1736340 RepID=UPI0006FE3A84|nr:hypothetical protein [Agreia sp. Leaf335]KQR24041.1 hypothetical protein ASF79_02035 [Agreia sp. Leaf335]